MASVYKRRNTFWIRFRWHGTEVRRSAHTSVKSVAQQFLVQSIEECQRLDRGGRPRHSYQEALERFCAEHLPTLKPATQSRYGSSFKNLQPIFGDLFLDEISKSRLAEFVTARRKTGIMGATVRRDLSALSSVCSFAVMIDMIETHPVKQFSKRHLRESVPRVSYPSDAEIEGLIVVASPAMGRVIRFLAETGMRLEEVASLEWSQVALHRREVRLIKTKTSSPRIVPLSEAAYDTLVSAPRHPTSPFVFWHSNGKRFSQFSSHFRRLANRVGFHYRCHDLRHRFASVFLQATADLPALQSVLGHKSIEMTMRYSHLLTGHLHEAIAKAGTKLGTRTPNREPSVAAEPPLKSISTGQPQVGLSWSMTATLGNHYSFNGVTISQADPLERPPGP